MGNPDLTDGFAPLERPLAELIRAGDVDALAGFRVAHVDKVRRYCAQVCAPELIEDATDAAFVDLVGRLMTGPALVYETGGRRSIRQ